MRAAQPAVLHRALDAAEDGPGEGTVPPEGEHRGAGGAGGRRGSAEGQDHVAAAVRAVEERGEREARPLERGIEHGAGVGLDRRARPRGVDPDDGTSACSAQVEARARPVRQRRARALHGHRVLAPRCGERRAEVRAVGARLRLRPEVHPVAAAAPIDDGARALDAIGAPFEHLEETTARGALAEVDAGADALARGGAADERRAPLSACSTRHTASPLGASSATCISRVTSLGRLFARINGRPGSRTVESFGVSFWAVVQTTPTRVSDAAMATRPSRTSFTERGMRVLDPSDTWRMGRIERPELAIRRRPPR